MKQINSIVLAALLAGCVQAYGCVFVQSSAISDRAGAGNPISSMRQRSRISSPGRTARAHADRACEPAQQLRQRQSIRSDHQRSMRDFVIVQSYNVSVSGVCN